jgi:parallel beta-helix repeat protein
VQVFKYLHTNLLSMACDNLVQTFTVSNSNPTVNDTVTCTSSVKNNGTTSEKFHIVFSANGVTFNTGTVKTVASGATVVTTAGFQPLTSGSMSICGDLFCDTTPTSAVYASDYGVGSTTGDESQFNINAIAAAAAHPSKTLVYPAGKTTNVYQQIRFASGLTVIGQGCTIKRIYNPNLIHVWFLALGAASGSTGVDFSGFIIDGNAFGVSHGGNGVQCNSNAYFHDNEVKNVREYSVDTYGSSNVVISNNTVHDGLQYGIIPDYATNITVTNNTIYNMMEVGIKIKGTDGAVITGNNVLMADSPNNGGDTPSHHTTVRGISLYSDDGSNNNILIQNNIVNGAFQGYDGDAISSDSANPVNTNVRILNNTVSKCAIGIDVHFSGGIVQNNTITNVTTCISKGGSGNTYGGNTCNGSLIP